MIDWPNPDNLECVEVATGKVVGVMSVGAIDDEGDRCANLGDGGVLYFKSNGSSKLGLYQIRNKAPALAPSLAAELLALPDAELRARLQAMVPETDEERALRRAAELWGEGFDPRTPAAPLVLAIHRKLQEEGL